MLPAKAGFKFKSKIPDFEAVNKSRSSGTQKLGKRGRFAKVSFWVISHNFLVPFPPILPPGKPTLSTNIS